MNQTKSKLLRKIIQKEGKPDKKLIKRFKKIYNRTPWNERAALIKTIINT
jgi:hypothetical protein